MSWTGDVSHARAAEAARPGSSPVPGPAWTAGDSGELYRIGRWGPPYFSIGARGHVAVRAAPGAARSIGLPAVVDEARRQGVQSPLTIRFPEILRAQVARLHGAFGDAIAAAGYGNRHLGLYPVKVNPLRHVVEEILDAGREYGMGLECGSRAELAAALPHLRDDRQLLVCNGAKDESMLALAMDAQRLGRQVIPVAQSPEEFAALRAIAGRRGDGPTLGVRIGLSGGIPGRWGRRAEPDAKFGLSPADLLALLEAFPDALPRLGLLHFHLGSQIADLTRLRHAAGEAAQVYASLVQRGAALQYLDVGGGLGVEYGGLGLENGDAGRAPAEPDYSLTDYAHAIVSAVNDVCRSRSVPPPVLVSESGRAVAAHHAALIVPVLSVRERRGFTADAIIPPQARTESQQRSLADRVLCGFSVFRSLPDHWGSGQAFPVMPIDRLNERPTRRGILVDLTCDTDGRISRYISSDPDASVLPMHPPRPGVRTELAFFLMGAYEDVLGAPHNLLGRVPEIHVRTDERAARGFRIDNIVPATTVAGLLTQMGYREEELRAAMENLVAPKVAADELSTAAGRRLIDRYAQCLGQGTYYETGGAAGPES